MLGDLLDQVHHTARVSPLVVIPSHKLHELGVERNPGTGIENGGTGVRDKVLADHGELSVADHALVGGLGSLLDSSADGLIGGGLGETGSQVHDGHIGDGDTEGHAGELALEGGDHLGDGLGGTGGGRDDVHGGRSAASPVLLGGAVDHHLGGSEGVYGRHERLLNAELVVDDLDDGGQAVGGAGRAREDVGADVVLLVDTHDDDLGVVLGGGGHDHLLGSTVDVHLAGVLGQECARGLAQVGRPELAPADLFGLAGVGGHDTLAVDDDGVALHVHLAVETAVHRVVLELVGHVLGISTSVDGDEVALGVLDGDTGNEATDAAEAVDPDGHGHVHVVGAGVLDGVQLEGRGDEGGGGAGQGQGADEGRLHGGHLDR